MHRVQLYPTSRQEAHLRFMLDVTRQTYNARRRQHDDRCAQHVDWNFTDILVQGNANYQKVPAQGLLRGLDY